MFPLFLITIIGSILTRLLTPTQKAGKLKDFTFPQINDGDPIYYMAGTNKITAPGMVWYGDYSTKAIKSGGIFGLFSSTTGYKYYLGWQLIFCIGPGVRLQNLWFGVNSEPKLQPGTTDTIEQYREENNPNFTDPNDPKVPTPILSGDFTTFQNKYLENKDAFGGSNSGGGYELHVSFYSGDFDQPSDTLLPTRINGFVPPYNGLCYIVADGYIGNTTQLQAMTAELTRIYDPLELGAQATIGDEGDANPANVIFELLTNNFGAASIPLPKMNNASFVASGGILFTEDEGISILSNSSPAALSTVLQDILRQIDGVLYEDPNDGTIHLDLIRADYDITTLLDLNESNILTFSNYTTNLWSDTKNRIRLKFEDRLKDYDDRTAVAEDMANVSFQDGQVKGINVEHPYIKRVAHANRKAADELAVYSTPLSKANITAMRIATSLRPASVILLTYGEYNITQLVLRVTKISYGDLINNHLTLDLVQDKFSKTDTIFGPPVNYYSKPYTGPVSVQSFDIIESPRFFNALTSQGASAPDSARIMSYIYAANSNQQAYNEWLKEDDEPSYQQDAANQLYAVLAVSAAEITQAGTADIPMAGISDSDVLAAANDFNIQTQGLNMILVDAEIMAYTGFTQDATSGLYTLTGIRRGLLDTIRADHKAGVYVVFLDVSKVSTRFFQETAAVVDIQLGSIAPAGEEDEDSGTSTTLSLTSRALHPYPPANVQLDGVALNPNVDNTNGVSLTFTPRDRLKATVSYETDAVEVPEAGTTYTAIYGNGGSFQTADLGTTGAATVLNFSLAGDNVVQVFSELNGLKSQVLEFHTNVAHASGISATADLGVATTAPVVPYFGAGVNGAGAGGLGPAATTAPVTARTTAANVKDQVGPGNYGLEDDNANRIVDASGGALIYGAPGTITTSAPSGGAGTPGTASGGQGTITTGAPGASVGGAPATAPTGGSYSLIDGQGNRVVDATGDVLAYEDEPGLEDSSGAVLTDGSGDELTTN